MRKLWFRHRQNPSNTYGSICQHKQSPMNTFSLQQTLICKKTGKLFRLISSLWHNHQKRLLHPTPIAFLTHLLRYSFVQRYPKAKKERTWNEGGTNKTGFWRGWRKKKRKEGILKTASWAKGVRERKQAVININLQNYTKRKEKQREKQKRSWRQARRQKISCRRVNRAGTSVSTNAYFLPASCLHPTISPSWPHGGKQ